MLDKPVRLNVTEKKSTVKFSTFLKKFVLMFQVIELVKSVTQFLDLAWRS